MTDKFTTQVDGDDIADHGTAADAIAFARDRFATQRAAGDLVTVCVVDPSGAPFDWRSNRRIRGTFTKQAWGGRKGDDAVFVGQEAFDATTQVLLLDLAEIHALRDYHDTTDAIGSSVVSWEGPFEVVLIDSMLTFFGVRRVRDITEQHVQFARAIYAPVHSTEYDVEVVLKVRVRNGEGISITDVIDGLRYSAHSTLPGAVIGSVSIESSKVIT